MWFDVRPTPRAAPLFEPGDHPRWGSGDFLDQVFVLRKFPVDVDTPERLAAFHQEFMKTCAGHSCFVGESEVIDQANAILFLASDGSRYLIGQWLVIDRGMCLQKRATARPQPALCPRGRRC
jgi:NAD(P)-dependent dehydrogenase (short-subunit alcohol dehydrogenase family)